jgi:hypothetical protein
MIRSFLLSFFFGILFGTHSTAHGYFHAKLGDTPSVFPFVAE